MSVKLMPLQPYDSFDALAQGAMHDEFIPVVPHNGMLCVCAVDGPVYITKDQAMVFFNLEAKKPEPALGADGPIC